MIDLTTLRLVLSVLTGWLDCREREAIAYLIEENLLLRRQLSGRRLRLTGDDRLRLQILGSTPHPEALFMEQIVRTLTMAHDGVLDTPTMLICDRDRKER